MKGKKHVKKQVYIICLQVVLLLIQPVVIFGFDGDKELYKKGKKHVVERKWKEAIEIFRELTDLSKSYIIKRGTGLKEVTGS